MNKIEQVCSLGHQMSLPMGAKVRRSLTVRSHGGGGGGRGLYSEVACLGEELGPQSLYSEVQCITGNDISLADGNYKLH